MKKLLLVFLLSLCFLILPKIVSADDGFTFHGTTTSIPTTPITYNNVTYSDYFYFFTEYGSSDNYLSVLFYNPTNSTIVTSENISTGDNIYIPADSYMYCTRFVDPATNTAYVDFSNASQCSLMTSASTFSVNYNSTDPILSTYFWSASDNVYDSITSELIRAGDLAYSRPVVPGATYDPGIVPVGTAKFFPISPIPTIQASTGLPIMYFSPAATSYKVVLSLILNYTHTHEHLQLYQGTTKIDDFDFCAGIPAGGICSPFQSSNGYITMALDGSDKIILNLSAVGDYNIRLIAETGSEVAAEYPFLVNETDSNLIINNQSDINSYCDNFPHTMTGNMIGFAYDFDFHTDDICKMIIPPDDYLSNKFSTTYQNFLGKFAFIGQVSSVVSGGVTLFSGTPVVPVVSSVSVLGHTMPTFDFSVVSSGAVILRRLTGVVMWIFTAIIIFRKVRSIFMRRDVNRRGEIII